MEHKSGCCICGNELVYGKNDEQLICFYCGQTFDANVSCKDGHYVCDPCHSSSANDIIERFCIKSGSADPIELALSLMRHPAVKMHGPEHHFLVPAVLLSAYYNQNERLDEKETKIKQARNRAEKVLGGFCGTHGICGAAVGTGIFVSLITDTTPLSTEGWKQANRTTAKALNVIAEHGGPRCCKRDSFLAIQSIMELLNSHFQSSASITCEFSDHNKECLKEKCPFYSGS